MTCAYVQTWLQSARNRASRWLPRVQVALAVALIAALWPAEGRSQTVSLLESRGGPMLATPEIAPVYLGTWAASDIADTQAYLAGLVDYMNGKGAPRGRESVLRQYGVVGASLLPAVGPLPIANTSITKGDVAALIRSVQSQSGAYGYAPGRIVLVMTAGIPKVDLGPHTGGFHAADGNNHYFAFVPTEINKTTPDFQVLISHEIFEAATDPKPGDDEAWIYWKSETCFVSWCWGETAEGADQCGTAWPPFGAVATFVDNRRASCELWSTAPQPVAGDFDGDGRSDIALVGGYTAGPPDARAPRNQVPIAYAGAAGGFPRQTSGSTAYMDLADTDNVTVLSGDFDGDGATDIAMVGGIGWATTPVFFSNRDGTFRFVNLGDATFAAWAQAPGVQAVAADFNGDHRTDIALAGADGWASIPMALSYGDGTFRIDNYMTGGASDFARLMSTPGAKLVAGQFDGTGSASVGVIGIADQWALFIKYQGYWANFLYSYDQAFSEYSALPGVKAFTGDFDGDGYDDIALSGGPGWASVPIAFTSPSSYGGFRVQNVVQWDFGVWATVPGVTPLAGRFANQHQSDMALVGGWGWRTVPINSLAEFPYSRDPQYETFRYVQNPVVGSSFPARAQ